MLPIVHLFFEKCETATRISELHEFDEMMTLSDNFPTEVAAYIEVKGGQLTTDNPELDNLVGTFYCFHLSIMFFILAHIKCSITVSVKHVHIL